MSGSLHDDRHRPPRDRPLSLTRVVARAFSPFVPALAVAASLSPDTAPSLALYETVSTGPSASLFVSTLWASSPVDRIRCRGRRVSSRPRRGVLGCRPAGHDVRRDRDAPTDADRTLAP
jgi:hypothetical protein